MGDCLHTITGGPRAQFLVPLTEKDTVPTSTSHSSLKYPSAKTQEYKSFFTSGIQKEKIKAKQTWALSPVPGLDPSCSAEDFETLKEVGR